MAGEPTDDKLMSACHGFSKKVDKIRTLAEWRDRDLSIGIFSFGRQLRLKFYLVVQLGSRILYF